MLNCSAREALERFQQSQFWAVTLLTDEDAYLEREFLSLLKVQGFEVQKKDLSVGGPSEEELEFLSSCSLFSSKKTLWLRASHSTKGWKSAALSVWSSLCSQSNGQDLLLFLQVPGDRRMKWDSLKPTASVSLGPSVIDARFWLEHMNHTRGNHLDSKRLEFLMNFGEQSLVLDNWIELWSLGGDLWAEKQLGWQQKFKDRFKTIVEGQTPLSFAWVDAVLMRRPQVAAELLQQLLVKESQEPLQLLGLLSKSVRILRALELRLDLKEYPPFLVKKLSAHRGRGELLIKRCASLDLKLKNSSLDPQLALIYLSS